MKKIISFLVLSPCIIAPLIKIANQSLLRGKIVFIVSFSLLVIGIIIYLFEGYYLPIKISFIIFFSIYFFKLDILFQTLLIIGGFFLYEHIESFLIILFDENIIKICTEWILILYTLYVTSALLFNISFKLLGITKLEEFFDLIEGKKKLSDYGNASFGNLNSLREKNNGEELYIGSRNKYFSKRKKYFKVKPKGHLMTIAPTRGGKGVGSIIPNLLTYEGSIICIDPKGENTRITAKRRREINNKVLIIDPWNISGEKELATLNPIDFLGDNDKLPEDVSYILDSLVYDNPNQISDSHWNEEAKTLIKTLLIYSIKERSGKTTLNDIRDLLTQKKDDFIKLLEELQKNPYEIIKRGANQMLSKAEKEFSSVLSTAQRHTQFIDSPKIKNSTNFSNFKVSDLIESNVSIFLVIPPDKIQNYKRWIRLILSYLIMGVVRHNKKPQKDIIFFIDEFSAIGKFDIIETGMGLMAGYGMKFWVFLQDLSQLKDLYKNKFSTFISNSSIMQIFGTNDYETAKYISDILGTTTITIKNKSNSVPSNFFNINGGSNSFSKNQVARKLMNPDEIINLDNESQIVLIEGKPYALDKIYYYKDKKFKNYLNNNIQLDSTEKSSNKFKMISVILRMKTKFFKNI